MRIAVSGTHCSGKSTLVEEFLLQHNSYKHEPEAFEALQSDDAFPEPTAESFFAQLEYHINRLRLYRQGDRVIFERSPFDYVAYLAAFSSLRRSSADSYLAKQSFSIAHDSFRLLDIIVFLPGSEIDAVSADEDPALRDAVDTILEDYLINDALGVLGASGPHVVQLTGSINARLRTLELLMTSLAKEGL
jgi:hypothetical protein